METIDHFPFEDENEENGDGLKDIDGIKDLDIPSDVRSGKCNCNHNKIYTSDIRQYDVRELTID